MGVQTQLETKNQPVDWSGFGLTLHPFPGVPADLRDLCLAITEHAPWPLALVEGPGHLLRQINPAFCRLIGKPREELIGKPFAGMMPEKDEYVTLLGRVYATGIAESHTVYEPAEPKPAVRFYSMWPVMGDEHPAAVMIQVTEIAQFQEQTVAMNEALILGSVHQHELIEAADTSNTILQREIGERKKAEESLRKAQALLTSRAVQLEGLVTARTAELTATNQQLEAFVYSIAHDLRAPLRSMQGFSAMMIGDEGTVLSDRARDFADRVDRSTQFMDAMLNDLLAFSRISQQRIELTTVNLATVVESVLARLGKDIQGKNGQVENAGPWPAVLAHGPTVAQVLVNLLDNALKFVAPGVTPQVHLWTEKLPGFVRVWVEDNGVGIAPEYQEQVFRLFNRLHGAKYPGTGIGLTIVKKGIERMGGRVGVESTPDQGSKFWIELPKSAPAGQSGKSEAPW